MRVKLIALAIASGVLVAGCGTSAAGGKIGQLFGVTLDKNGKPYVMTDAERRLQRFGVLQTTEACAECDVTGGGNGRDATFACGDANFGLSAITTPGGTVNGNLNFLFDLDGGRNEYHFNGPVDFVRCIDLVEGTNGDTTGIVEFGGQLRLETGLDTSETYDFVVRVEDHGEPNTDDDFAITVTNTETGAIAFTYTCTAEDGNIQIHPTRFSNL